MQGQPQTHRSPATIGPTSPQQRPGQQYGGRLEPLVPEQCSPPWGGRWQPQV